MPTLLDEFVLSLNLDTTKFNKGQVESMAKLKKWLEEMSAGGREVEKQGKAIVDFFNKMKTEFIAFAGVSFGGYEFKQMINNITSMDAAIGRTAYTSNISTEALSTWMQVVQRTGGEAEDARSAVVDLNKEIMQVALGHHITPQLAYLSRLIGGIDIAKFAAGKGDIGELFLRLRAATEGMNPALRATALQQAGLPPGLINALVRGDLPALLKTAQSLGNASRLSAEEAQRYQDATQNLDQAWTHLERNITDKIIPTLSVLENALTKALSGFSTLLDRVLGTKDEKGKPVAPTRSKEEWWYDFWHGKGAYGRKFGGYPSGYNPGGGSTETAPSFAVPSGPAFAGDPRHLIPFIRATAASMGIDPDVAVKVAQSEGLSGFSSGIKGETSWGAFQLHTGGGLGDTFKSQTGLDPSDPKNEAETIKWALAWARNHGWGPWHGAAKAGLGPWTGINGSGPAPSTNTKSTTIGSISIYTQSKDAVGIANDIRTTLANTALT